MWYVLWKTKSNKEYIEVLKKLESAMSNTRKGNSSLFKPVFLIFYFRFQIKETLQQNQIIMMIFLENDFKVMKFET